ncbi:tetratricopeptide repeat protein [Namhaeicola litoreus]|uniref:Tetratricopeptide repeat protein n=1 Tax=Namhaeicola litoreus TaxID=1052145 RepID=A0ABW3XWX2_9FLAO
MKLIKLFLVFIVSSINAQQNNLNMDSLSSETCSCIEKINITEKHKNQAVNKCLSQTIANHIQSDMASTEVITEKRSAEIYKLVENHLIDNCKALKSLMFTETEDVGHVSSKNVLAQLAYDDGMDYLKEEDLPNAIEKFKKAVLLDPEFVYAWDNLGVSYRKNNELDLAIEAYQNSLKIFPNGKLPLINLAVVYNVSGNAEKSREYYKKYCEIFPEDPEGYYGLGLIEYSGGQLESGLDNLVHSFILYSAQQSPYRSDAAGKIGYIYNDLKSKNQTEIFDRVVHKYDLKIKMN